MNEQVILFHEHSVIERIVSVFRIYLSRKVWGVACRLTYNEIRTSIFTFVLFSCYLACVWPDIRAALGTSVTPHAS